MPTFRPEVPDNIRSLQRQITRSGTAPLGPVSITGDEGSIRAYTGTGDTFIIRPDGASFAFRGSTTGLTPHLEANATQQEQQDTRLDGHDGDVTRIDAKNTAQDGVLGDHREWIIGQGERLDGHDADVTRIDAKNAAQDTTLGGHSTRITTAQSRADSAYSRAGDALSDAATAQSTANGAVSVNGTQNTRLSSLESQMGNTASASDMNSLINDVQALRAWLAANTPYPGSVNSDAKYFLSTGTLPS